MPEDLFERRAVRRVRPIEVVGPGQDLEAGLVLGDQLAQELRVEAVHVVEGVDQRVAAADTQEQPDFAETGLEVDDQRALVGQARELDGAVHGDGRRAGAAFRTEEHERRRRLPVTRGRAA